MFCLPEKVAEVLKAKFKKGEINPGQLMEMNSIERRALFSEFMGETNARSVNALFESKLLLKRQQEGIVAWAEKIVGLKPEAKRDILTKVERLTEVLEPRELEAFLNDLANQRLGFDVTLAEAGKIAELSREVVEAKERVKSESPNGSAERLEYGLALDVFKQYVGELRGKAKEVPLRELYKHPAEAISRLGGFTKSVLSTLDNSFFGRQGIKVLYTKPSIWAKNFIKSWGDIGKELKGVDAMTPIRADVMSRKNALNGNYERMKLDIGLLREEAFPSSAPQRIPVFGRIFKAAESAYNGAGLRMRADLADWFIRKAEEMGIDITDKVQAQSIGNLVNSMTGRGNIGKLGVAGKEINATLFSVKFLKSNWDFITAHQFQKNVTPFVRRQAATNLLKAAGTVAGIQLIANALWPDSVDKKHLGKVKIGGVWIDITGGFASIGQLAFNMIEKVTTQSGKYGERTALDIFEDFWEGKLSPMAGLLRDVLRGQNFQGEKPGVVNSATNLLTPIPIQTFEQLRKGDVNLGLWIFDALGFSTTVPHQTNWNQNPGLELSQFRDKVGQDKFDEANKLFNNQYQDWFKEVQTKDQYKSLSEDDKKQLQTNKKGEIKDRIFRQFNFKYKKAKSTPLPKL